MVGKTDVQITPTTLHPLLHYFVYSKSVGQMKDYSYSRLSVLLQSSFQTF